MQLDDNSAYDSLRRAKPSASVKVVGFAVAVAGLLTMVTPATGQERTDASAPDTPQSAAFHEQVVSILQRPATRLGKGFTGAWIDSSDRGRIYIGFKGQGEVARARLEPTLIALRDDPRITFVDQKFTISDLDAAMNRVATKLNELLATPPPTESWPFEATVDTRENVIDVSIDRSKSHHRGSIEETLATDIDSGIVKVTYDEQIDQRRGENDCSNRLSCQPIRGGLHMTSPDSACTTGFVFRNSAGARFSSTAGHCGGLGQRIYHPAFSSTFIGDIVWRQLLEDGRLDVAIVDVENPATPYPNNSIFRVGASESDKRITTKISTPGPSLIGNYLCAEAAVSSTTCGSLLSYNSTFLGQVNMGKYAATTCAGDSGAPVVANTTNRAYGLHAGAQVPAGGTCGSPAYFTWSAYVEAESPYTLLLRRATERLEQNETLIGQFDDQRLDSVNTSFTAVMQSDGNFVLYQTSGGAVWSSGTNGHSGAQLRMQTDGNLVIYHGSTPIWSASTAGFAGSYLQITGDGHVEVRDNDSNNTLRWRRPQ